MARSSVHSILRVINEFEAGRIDVEQLQSRLDAQAAAMDNSERELLEELRAVDNDLERIRFAMHAKDQPGAARDRLHRLRTVIESVK